MFAAKLIKFWLNYKNDWLSIENYAEYHGMTTEDAMQCTKMGRQYAELYKWHLDIKGEVVITGAA